MWDAVPWVLLAAGLGLLGWMAWLKFNGREIPQWLKWVSYAVNAFAMVTLALRGRRKPPAPIDPDDEHVVVNPPEPHIDDAEKIIQEAVSESVIKGEEAREAGDDTTAENFGSTFGTNIGAPTPTPPKE